MPVVGEPTGDHSAQTSRAHAKLTPKSSAVESKRSCCPCMPQNEEDSRLPTSWSKRSEISNKPSRFQKFRQVRTKSEVEDLTRGVGSGRAIHKCLSDSTRRRAGALAIRSASDQINSASEVGLSGCAPDVVMLSFGASDRGRCSLSLARDPGTTLRMRRATGDRQEWRCAKDRGVLGTLALRGRKKDRDVVAFAGQSKKRKQTGFPRTTQTAVPANQYYPSVRCNARLKSAVGYEKGEKLPRPARASARKQ